MHDDLDKCSQDAKFAISGKTSFSTNIKTIFIHTTVKSNSRLANITVMVMNVCTDQHKCIPADKRWTNLKLNSNIFFS